MKRLIMAGVLLGLCTLRVQAADAPAAGDDPVYTAAATLRYVDLDFKGSRGQVQEYDGKLYKGAHGDVNVSNQGAAGLFDLSVKDIGSTEEEARVNADYKDTVRFNASWLNMHHRLNERGAGLLSNNTYQNNPLINATINPDQNLLIRRTESEINLGLFSSLNSARWFMVRYWQAEKVGSTPQHVATYQLGRANINNLTQDIRVGFGHDLGEKGAGSLDLIRTEFQDYAQIIPYPLAAVGAGNTRVLRPTLPHVQSEAADARFRYAASEKLSITGAAAARERQNLGNLYKVNYLTGALNAAYRASQKLSLLAKFNLDADETIENNEAKYIVTPATARQTHFDKTALKGEFVANWKPVQKVAVKASYKMELTNRRDAMTEAYNPTTPQYFYDGTTLPTGSWNNSVAHSDTRHTFRVAPKVELPFGMELEAEYKRLQANRAVFVGQPNRSDDASLTFTAPLPASVVFSAVGGFTNEKNTNNTADRNYSAKRNIYRAALDWGANARTNVGMDASYDSLTTIFNGYFGGGSATSPGIAFYENAMRDTQRNTSLGAHGRVILPKGLVVTARGTYTWSKIQTPLHFWNPTAGYSIDDYSPSDVRIARGSVGVEYTPERYKNITASASYAIDDWVDKTDATNSGRASVGKVGMTTRF